MTGIKIFIATLAAILLIGGISYLVINKTPPSSTTYENPSPGDNTNTDQNPNPPVGREPTSPQLIGAGYLSYGAPAVVSGLRANTTYHFRIAAENSYGKVYGEILSFQTTNTPPGPSIPPSAQTKAATDIGQKSVILRGTVNPQGNYSYY